MPYINNSVGKIEATPRFRAKTPPLSAAGAVYRRYGVRRGLLYFGRRRGLVGARKPAFR